MENNKPPWGKRMLPGGGRLWLAYAGLWGVLPDVVVFEPEGSEGAVSQMAGKSGSPVCVLELGEASVPAAESPQGRGRRMVREEAPGERAEKGGLETRCSSWWDSGFE